MNIKKFTIFSITISFFMSLVVFDFGYAQREITSSIEEIVVTAQKREENLQDVPSSVSAMDAATLEKTFARDLLDVAGVSPNLIIDPILGNGTAAISIRGVQMNDVEKSFDPAVAVYQDGIYLATATGALLNTWDAERIEVLRGPQGTMFGRNTIGGLVHVIRSKPTGELGGKINITAAEDSQTDVKAVLNLPALLNGTLATKFTAMRLDGGEYFYNPTRQTDEGGVDVEAYSFSALWNPTDNLQIQLTYDDIDDQTDVRPVSCFTQPGELFGVVGQPIATECNGGSDLGFHRTVFQNTKQSASVEVEAVTLNVEYDINENNKIVFVYGTREMEETSLQEFDASALELFRVSRPQFEEQESIEVRWESKFTNGQFTLGGYLWDSEYDAWQTTYFFGGFNDSPRTLHSTENTAFFGQLDYDVTDKITLTVGGRWIDEEKDFCQMFTLNAGDETPIFNWFGSSDPDPRIIQKSWGQCPGYVPASTAQNDYTDPVTGENATFTGTESWDDFTPKVGLTYELENGIAYATYSEGFRSGGFNGRATGANNAGPYDPETVESFEFGIKTIWANNTFQFNASAFTVDYTDKQEDVVLPGTDGAVTLTIVQNAAAVSIDGLEIESLWIPTEGLTLTANLGILDANYDNYMVQDGAGNMVDKSSFDLRRAPEMTLALGALHEYALTNGNFIVSSLNYRWKDDYCIQGNNFKAIEAHYGANPACNKAHGIIDASISYETENWRLSLFGKNLGDEDYLLHFLDVASSVNATSASDSTPVYVPGLWSFGTVNRPRYFGVEFEAKF